MEQNQQFQKMTQTPVGKLIATLSIPTIISMLVTAIYNMADTFFVSKLGTSASGAVGIVFSVMAIIQAIGFTFGMGSGSWISRLLGAKEESQATEVAATGFYSAIFICVVMSLVGEWKLDELMRILGASETILPYAREYARYILLAAPIMASSFVLNNILRSEGHAKFAMIGITTGGILNVLLDPLFIFTFRMGIAGAAVATALSQLTSFCILLSYFVMHKTTTRLGIHRLSKRPMVYYQIIKNGMPSFSRQGLASIASILLNQQAAIYGDAAVAAMAIVTKVFMMIFSVMIGFGQGYQPVVGFNYGAGITERVKKAMKFTLIVGMIGMTSAAVVLFMAAPLLMKLFISDDPAVLDIGTMALRAQAISMPLIPIGTVANMTFQSVGKAWRATIMSSMRQGIFFIPLIFILPAAFGLNGVVATQAAADILTALTCAPLLYHFYKNLTA
ncbi:MAG: MATE family efflux transporter [Lachnospiraceae bacterium]|nr:MATE family efflux transporter [Lachnospiraceae bacterium]